MPRINVQRGNAWAITIVDVIKFSPVLIDGREGYKVIEVVGWNANSAKDIFAGELKNGFEPCFLERQLVITCRPGRIHVNQTNPLIAGDVGRQLRAIEFTVETI